MPWPRSSVVRVLVEMLAPYEGRVYDPCCGSGGMFVSSEKFIEAHSSKVGDISIYGRESEYTTCRLAKMSVTIDWTVHANLRVIVKRILRKYGYRPDKQEQATQTVLEQAESLSQEWAVA